MDDATKGIDDYTVDAAAVEVTKNGEVLVEGTDYDFAYSAGTDAITLTPTGAGDFEHGCYQVTLNGGSSKITDLATPANELAETRYVSTAVVSLGFRPSEQLPPLNGFGFIIPKAEGRRITACTWSSTKFD
ncbi:MAG: hypothetical protein ABUK03_05050, partial [Dehalococcoidales bacterium]